MATVQFFRKHDTSLLADDISRMDSDSFYVTTYDNYPYLFYKGKSFSVSPSKHSPTRVDSSGDGTNYYLQNYYQDLNIQVGDQFLIQLDVDSVTTTPNLDDVPVRRRISGAETPVAGPSANWLKVNTAYLMTYTRVGTNYYWIVEGKDQASWYDLYGKPSNVAVIKTSTSNTTAPTTLTSGQLYIIYDN